MLRIYIYLRTNITHLSILLVITRHFESEMFVNSYIPIGKDHLQRRIDSSTNIINVTVGGTHHSLIRSAAAIIKKQLDNLMYKTSSARLCRWAFLLSPAVSRDIPGNSAWMGVSETSSKTTTNERKRDGKDYSRRNEECMAFPSYRAAYILLRLRVR